MPEVPLVCMQKKPGAGRWEKKCRGLGIRNIEGQKMLNRWPQKMMDAEHNTYSVLFLPHPLIPHNPAGFSPNT